MTAGGVNPPGTGHDEDGLVEAARTDRQAFGVLYDRHFDAIYHYIARRVGDAETAEDIASHVWERALKAIERYEIRGFPSPRGCTASPATSWPTTTAGTGC